MKYCVKHTILYSLFCLLAAMQMHAIPFYSSYKLLTQKTEFTAGETITLQFLSTTPLQNLPKLYISNSFGNTVIRPKQKQNTISYNVPYYMASRAGIINWKLITKTPLKGQITIIPKQEVALIQTYLGPPSIATGAQDYTMLVSIPTDPYDNPLANGTKVAVKHRFLNRQTIDTIKMKYSIAYRNIYSTLKSGRILINSSCYAFNSKEYDVNVMPSPATNFKISSKRHHNFADGNQIVTLTTSSIKDTYGNIVSDGTYVTFFIRNATNAILKASGTTIDGVATARIVHPNHEASWQIKAYIDGMAESNTIALQFKAVIVDFNIAVTDNNRCITVGPLISFMDQMIPDGLEVTLELYKNNALVDTLRKGSAEGYVQFKLNPNQFPNGCYTFKIRTAGIDKTVKEVTLW